MGAFTVHVEFDLSPLAKEWIMSALSDATAKLQASVDAATTRVQADIAALRNQVAALQARIDAGGLTQADEDAAVAAMGKAQAQIDVLDPSNPATLPTA